MKISHRSFLVAAFAVLIWQSATDAATIKITAGDPVLFGRQMVGATPSSNVTLTKTGGGSVTFTTSGFNNGITAPGGTFSTTTFSEPVTLVNNANGSASTGLKNYVVNFSPLTPSGDGQAAVSATILSHRLVTVSSGAVSFGNLLKGANVFGISTLATTGDDNNRTRVNVALTTAADANGISVTPAGFGSLFNSASSTGVRFISGQLNSYGSISGNLVMPVTTAEVASVGDTVAYPGVTISYSANVGNATASKANSVNTFGPTLTALVFHNGSYAGLESRVVGTTGSGGLAALNSVATIKDGKNVSGTDFQVNMAWRTRTTAEAPVVNTMGLEYYKPISDIVKISGMANHLDSEHGGKKEGGDHMGDHDFSNQTDTYVLQMTYTASLLHFSESFLAAHGKIYLAGLTFEDDSHNGDFENAVLGNFGGPSTVGNPVLSSYAAYFAGNVGSHGFKSHNAFVLGDWGVDTTNDVVWAVINYQDSFAAVPEPSTLMLAGMGFALLTAGAVRNRRRRLAV